MSKIRFKIQLKEIDKAVDTEIRKAALGFHSDIVRSWPVALINSQDSKGAWVKPIKEDDGYVVTNRAHYSPILWRGVHTINGKKYGSEQMTQGGIPILNNSIAILKKRLKRL